MKFVECYIKASATGIQALAWVLVGESLRRLTKSFMYMKYATPGSIESLGQELAELDMKEVRMAPKSGQKKNVPRAKSGSPAVAGRLPGYVSPLQGNSVASEGTENRAE